MPTLGWVLEGDIERFLAGTTKIDGHRQAYVTDHPCAFCRQHFDTAAALSQHLASSHIGDRPFLTIEGVEPNQNEVVRKAHEATSINIFNCTRASVSRNGHDFRNCDTAQLPKIFVKASGRIWLRLENAFAERAEPVRSDYDIEFRVPSSDELEQVDRTFVRLLGRVDPTIHDVDVFIQACPSGAITDYVRALADYVLGILLKDDDPVSGVGPGDRDYRPKLNNALRTLQTLNRPLPALLAAMIRFSANDFTNWTTDSGLPRLDAANATLGPLHALGQGRSASMWTSHAGGSPVCPIDNGSDAVMHRLEQLATVVRWSDQLDDLLRVEVELPSLDPLDRVKLTALWAQRAIALNRASHAIEPLRRLVGDHCFGQWAERMLEEHEA